MKQKHSVFPPDFPKINDDTINNLKNIDQKEFKKSYAYKKYIKPAIKSDNKRKRSIKIQWWKENWISVLSLIFCFIAALPVIIQGISYILKLLM